MKVICVAIFALTFTMTNIFGADLSEMLKVYRPKTLILPLGHLETTVDFSQFKTQKHFDDQGRNISLVGSENYTRSDLDFNLNYGLKSYLETFIKGNYRQNNSVDSTGKAESNKGLESLNVGMFISPSRLGDIDFSIKLNYRRALYKNDFYYDDEGRTTAVIALGDDNEDFDLGFNLGSEVGSGKYLSMELNYVKRTRFSDEILYKLSSAFWGNSVAIVPGIEGILSLSNDPYGGKQSQRPLVKRGSTYLVNGANRGKVAPFIEGTYALSNDLKINVGYKHTVSGNSTDGGYQVHFGLTYLISTMKNKSYISSVVKNEKEDSFFEIKISKWSKDRQYLSIKKGYLDGQIKNSKVDILQKKITGESTTIGHGLVMKVEKDESVIKVEYIDQGILLEEYDDIFIRGKKI